MAETPSLLSAAGLYKLDAEEAGRSKRQAVGALCPVSAGGKYSANPSQGRCPRIGTAIARLPLPIAEHSLLRMYSM